MEEKNSLTGDVELTKTKDNLVATDLTIHDEIEEDVINIDNPKVNEKELTAEEEKEQKIKLIQSMHFRYNPKKDFGDKFKAKRKRKNKLTKQSRKNNRKKK
jgi:hypothetical protein